MSFAGCDLLTEPLLTPGAVIYEYIGRAREVTNCGGGIKVTKVLRFLLVCCILTSVVSAFPGRAMYMDPPPEGYVDELLEYMEDHDIVIEGDDNTIFTSLEAIKREIEKREQNWQELASQEWGVQVFYATAGFGDLNLLSYPEGTGEEERTEWRKRQQKAQLEGGPAIVFTPSRTFLAVLGLSREIYGDEEMRERLKNLEEEWELENSEGETPNHFYLGFILRLPIQECQECSVSLRYEDKELEPIFSFQRESKIYYEEELNPWGRQFSMEHKEEWERLKEEWDKLGLGWDGTIATFFYFNFRIENQDFDPEGTMELWFSTEFGEEAFFDIDLSKMR